LGLTVPQACLDESPPETIARRGTTCCRAHVFSRKFVDEEVKAELARAALEMVGKQPAWSAFASICEQRRDAEDAVRRGQVIGTTRVQHPRKKRQNLRRGEERVELAAFVPVACDRMIIRSRIEPSLNSRSQEMGCSGSSSDEL